MKVKMTEFYEREEVEKLGEVTPIASICITNDFSDPVYKFVITKACWETMKRRERRDEEKEEKEKRETLLIEYLASLEHDLWCEWSKEIVKTEHISHTRSKCWESFWIPYGLLSEEIKEHDRKWARKVLKTVRDNEAFWRKNDVEAKRVL